MSFLASAYILKHETQAGIDTAPGTAYTKEATQAGIGTSPGIAYVKDMKLKLALTSPL
eukprot:gene3854-13916_t